MRLAAVVAAVSLIAPFGAIAAAAEQTATTKVGTILDGGVGDTGPATDALVAASAIDQDPLGNLVFYDRRSRQVRRVDALTGQVSALWGSGADSTTWPKDPVSAASAPLPYVDRIWTTTSGEVYLRAGRDLAMGDVYRIGTDGMLRPAFRNSFNQFGQYTFPAGTYYRAVFVRRDGSLLVSKSEQLSDGTGKATLLAMPPGDPASTSPTALLDGGAIDVDEAADGTLFVVNGNPRRVLRVTPSGSEVVLGPGVLSDGAFGVSAAGTLLFFTERVGNSEIALRVEEPGGSIRTVGRTADTAAGDDICPYPSTTGAGQGVLFACGGPVRELAYDGAPDTRGTKRYGRNEGGGPVSSPDGTPAARAFLTSVGIPTVDPRDGSIVMGADYTYRLAGIEGLTRLERILGGGTPGDHLGDGGPARDAEAYGGQPVFAADGSFVTLAWSRVGGQQQWRIREVDPSGVVRTLAGGGTRTGNLDGVDAREASLEYGSLALSADGRTVYFAQDSVFEGTRVFAVPRAGGPIRRIAGGAGTYEIGQGAQARDVSLPRVTWLQADPSGALYLSSGSGLLRIGPDGVVAAEPMVGGYQHLVGPDGSIYAASGSVIWKRRPDGSFVVVSGRVRPAPSAAGDLPVAPAGLGLLPDGRLLVGDIYNRPTNALRALTTVDRDWTGPAPTLTATPEQAGQFGSVTVRVDVPAGPAPWTIKLRGAREGMPGHPEDGTSLLDFGLPAEGGSQEIALTRLSYGCVNTSSCAQIPAGAEVNLALFALSGNGEQAPPPVRSTVVTPDSLIPTVIEPISPPVLTYDKPVELSARLVQGADGAPVAGEKLTLQRRHPYYSEWTTVGTPTTGPDGVAKVTEAPKSNATYRWTFAGSDTHRFTGPAELAVSVKPTISATGKTLVKAGSPIVFTATVPVPSAVYLEERVGGIWKQLQMASSDPDGNGGTKYVATLATKSSARREFRLVTQADDQYAQGTSATFVVDVYSAAISTIHGNAKGDDAKNLNDEYLTLKNTGTVALNLKGWVLATKSTKRSFTLPSFTLAPGASVTVRAGKGTNSKKVLYLKSTKPIWSNTEDTGAVYDPQGVAAATHSYPRK